MASLKRVYDGLIYGLAVLGALVLVLVVVGIIVDVTLRNLGRSPVQATSALIEYALLFVTMAGAPWLVRERGHVSITAMVRKLPTPVAAVFDRGILVVSIAVLGLLSWRATAVTFESVARGAVDIRSIALAGWILPAILAVGFGLMATEFLRLLLRGETYAAARPPH